ncbi:MAG: hypothetical protein C4B59_16595 [Candidatus Methanogaster sp.]|uniref:Uncharacterized protein n=1 Tax=Candidatus Methanogaster sp. TaxID=3386292 RepID=A0AC61KY35_9EURY|nr:MAG: hypothetical protein C4B59_16595 [ANME-2 cluster archaeon]
MTGEIITVKEPNIGYVIVGAVFLNLMLVPCGIGWLIHKSILNDEITPFWTVCGYYGQMTVYGIVTLTIGLLIVVLLVVALGIIAGAIFGT